MDLHRFRTQNELFIYFSKKVTFYLNIYCNLKYNLMYSCNLSAPIPFAVYLLLGSMVPSPCIIIINNNNNNKNNKYNKNEKTYAHFHCNSNIKII